MQRSEKAGLHDAGSAQLLDEHIDIVVRWVAPKIFRLAQRHDAGELFSDLAPYRSADRGSTWCSIRRPLERLVAAMRFDIVQRRQRARHRGESDPIGPSDIAYIADHLPALLDAIRLLTENVVGGREIGPLLVEALRLGIVSTTLSSSGVDGPPADLCEVDRWLASRVWRLSAAQRSSTHHDLDGLIAEYLRACDAMD